MTVFGGIDVGAQSVKVVLLRDSTLLTSHLLLTEEEAETAARQALDEALARARLVGADLTYLVATGIGRGGVSFAQKTRTEQMCHAAGARWLFPRARTVLDTGFSGSRALKLGDDGRLMDFAMNSKCASGTGSFLEMAAGVLEVPLEKMGELSAETEEKVRVSSFCAVFAESEIITHIHRGRPRQAILAGVHESVVDRLVELLQKVGLREDIVMTGGVAKNKGIIGALQARLGLGVKVPEEPQIVGALGAALLAQKTG